MQKNTLFPVGCDAHWFSPAPEQLSKIEQNWLLDQSSLTARLKTKSKNFKVELLGQQPLAMLAHEAELLARHTPRLEKEPLVREVLLYCDAQPWVFARSIIPESLQADESSILTNLGSQALGERLFQQGNLLRSEFQIAKFEQQSSVHQLASKLGFSSTRPLWGRRSCFIIHQQPLLVQEVFLPAASLYNNSLLSNQESV